MRGGFDSKPKQEPVGMQSEQTGSGMEPDQEPAAMDMATADISVKDMEDFDSFFEWCITSVHKIWSAKESG